MQTSALDSRFIPAPDADSKSLMLVLHGLGDSLQGYLPLIDELDLPHLNFLLLNAPDPYFQGFSWYDFLDNPNPGILRSRELLFQLLDETNAHGFPFEKTVLFGFSQGSLMVLDVGLRFPSVLAGVCGVSGYLAFESETVDQLSPVIQEQRFFLSAGEYDPVIPYGKTKSQYQRLIEAGVPIDFRTYKKEHTFLPIELIDIRNWLLSRTLQT